MAVASSQISVGTGTPTALATEGDGESVVVTNLGTGPIYLGSDTVTSTTGLQVVANQVVTVGLGLGDLLYAVSGTGTQSVHVLRTEGTPGGFVNLSGPLSSASAVILGSPQYALSIPSTGGPLSLTVPSGATHALMTCDPASPANIRWTWGGTNPSATVGHVLQPGDTYEFDNVAILLFYAEASGVIAQVSYRHY